MPPKYIAPSLHTSSFNCPRCGVLCQQQWYGVYEKSKKVSLNKIDLDALPAPRRSIISYADSPSIEHFHQLPPPSWDLKITICNECTMYTVWHQGKIIFPSMYSDLPEPSDDMPDDAKVVYEEAREIFEKSPRGAAALLRLSIEMVIIGILGEKKSLNIMIQKLVEREIPEYIQKGLDVLRHFGNEGIHPGEIDLNEDNETVVFLFELINSMVEELISRKKKIESFYAKLPDGVKDGIATRGGKKK